MVQAPVTPPIKPPTRQLTDEEFLQFLREDNSDNLYELVDGWIHVMAEPGGKHEDLCAEFQFCFETSIRKRQLPLKVHHRIVCRLARGNQRRPDLIVVNKQMWRRNTSVEAILEEPPELVVEIVSTHWKDDYVKKAEWYAAFGVKEYWICDLLLLLNRYPDRKNPDIKEPTLSLGTLKNGAYQWQRFTGDRPIESVLFPDLDLTVTQLLKVAE